MKIEELYNKYGPMIHRRCLGLLKDEDLAWDITQEVFIRVIKKESSLDLEKPSSLLYRIATNLCLNYIRDHKRELAVEDNGMLEQIAQMEEPEGRLEARSFLRKLLGKNEESTRVIAVLHYVDGFTLEETAKEVGMSVSGIRKRLRGLKALAEQVEVGV